MFRRCWLPILAVIGLTLSAHAQSVDFKPTSEPSAAQSTKPKPAALLAVPTPVQDSLNRIGAALEAANSKPQSLSEKEHAQKDLDAQNEMAKWAKRVFFVAITEAGITFTGVMLLLATLIYTKRAAEAARDAVTKANDTMEQAERHAQQQLRAYVFSFERTVQIVDQGNAIKCWIKFRNSGQTPAYKCSVNVSTDIDHYPTPSESDIPPWSDDENSCLGPSDVMTFFWVLYPTKKEWNDLNSGKQAIWCRGVARYFDTFDVQRRTEFCFFVFGEEMGSGEKEMMLFASSGNGTT